MISDLRRLVMPGIMIALLLFCSGCTQDRAYGATAIPTDTISPAVPSAPATATKEEMVAFVKEAAAYAQKNGKAKALAEFSRRNGSFFRGELYIYAYDYNGTTIAHPVNPEKIGINRLREKDAEGNLFIENLRSAAMNGTGFVTYYYINPTHNNREEKKLGYAMMVDPSWWLGSGIYQGPADTPVSPATSKDMDKKKFIRTGNPVPVTFFDPAHIGNFREV